MSAKGERVHKLTLAFLAACAQASKADESLTLGECYDACDRTKTVLENAFLSGVWDDAFGNSPALPNPFRR